MYSVIYGLHSAARDDFEDAAVALAFARDIFAKGAEGIQIFDPAGHEYTLEGFAAIAPETGGAQPEREHR